MSTLISHSNASLNCVLKDRSFPILFFFLTGSGLSIAMLTSKSDEEHYPVCSNLSDITNCVAFCQNSIPPAQLQALKK